MNRLLKPAVFAACALPLAKLAVDFARDDLTANPIEAVMNRLGFWTLTALTATLACTPAKIVLGWTWPNRVRRMLGVWTFSYATLHLATYLVLDQFFDWEAIGKDIAKRPFISVGFATWAVLAPLAATSMDRMVRGLGYRAWKGLHRLAYLAALGGAIHFAWRVKADLRRPLAVIAVLSVLMAIRVVDAIRRRARAASRLGSATDA